MFKVDEESCCIEFYRLQRYSEDHEVFCEKGVSVCSTQSVLHVDVQNRLRLKHLQFKCAQYTEAGFSQRPLLTDVIPLLRIYRRNILSVICIMCYYFL